MRNYRFIIATLLLFLCINATAQENPCTGKEFTTDELFYRSNAQGTSMDATASRKKALSNARTSLVSQISQSAEKAIEEQDCEEAYKKKMIALAMIAIRQECAKTKVICEKSSNSNQKYQSVAVVELSKEAIKKSIIAQITGDNTLVCRFNIEKFQISLR